MAGDANTLEGCGPNCGCETCGEFYDNDGGCGSCGGDQCYCPDLVKRDEVCGIVEPKLEAIRAEQQAFFEEIRALIINQVCIKDCPNNKDVTLNALSPIDPNNLKVGRKLTLPAQDEFYPVKFSIKSWVFDGLASDTQIDTGITNGVMPAGWSEQQCFDLTNPSKCCDMTFFATLSPEANLFEENNVSIEYNLLVDGSSIAGDTINAIGTTAYNGDYNGQTVHGVFTVPAGDTVEVCVRVQNDDTDNPSGSTGVRNTGNEALGLVGHTVNCDY